MAHTSMNPNLIYFLWAVVLISIDYSSCQGMPGPGGQCCRGGGGSPPPQPGPPPRGMWQGGQQSPGGSSGNYYNISIPATIVINYNGSTLPNQIQPVAPINGSTPVPPTPVPPTPATTTATATATSLPVALPNGSLILYNGNIRFPNNTVLLTKYNTSAVLPIARLPSGTLMFSNGTKVASGTVTSFPAPGVPLNSTEEATTYPSVILPDNSVVYRNGSVVATGLKMMPTVFVKGVVPTCVGVTCHYATA